jgi:uncharacterized protein (DUF302 family)
MKAWLAGTLSLTAAVAITVDARADGDPPGLVTVATRHDFKTLVDRLETAVQDNKMLVVARASASAGAAGRGVTIPGDAVVLVFRNDFAVRMLAARVSAGIEAPIPIHVFETGATTASLGYRLPSKIFKPYGEPELDRIASELDVIFGQIVTAATGG